MASARNSANLFIKVMILLLGACSVSPERVKVANPASVNCYELGGRLESMTAASGGEYGLCHLPGGVVCEEWALYRKQCP